MKKNYIVFVNKWWKIHIKYDKKMGRFIYVCVQNADKKCLVFLAMGEILYADM